MEDQAKLLAEESTQSDAEQPVYESRQASKFPFTKRTVNGHSGSPKRNAADLPFSVEDYSSSHSIKVPRKQSRHYPQRPRSRKWTTRLRWCLGVTVVVGIIVLATVGIYLVYTSPEPAPIWWTSAIIYQCYPQSFQDSDSDGTGDLKGIRKRIGHFSDIGVQAVWLNPIFDSPQRDNGYDVSNYTAIDKKYGTMDDLRELLTDLHSRGLKLILDFVPNHTSDEHPWFKESRSSKTNPKRDWYVWADGNGDGPPNNWISLFGGSAWTYDNTTNQWYLHQFSNFQPDLNYRNKEVVGNMSDVLKFWLDFGVDGFRVDAIAYLLEDPKLKNETNSLSFNDSTCVNNITEPNCYNSLIHNLTSNYPGLHNITKHWKTIIDQYATEGNTKVFIAEIYDNIETVMKYYGTNGDEFSFPFNFFLLDNTEWSGTSVSCVIAKWINNMPPGPFHTANWVLGNHDNPRIASKAGVHLAKALNVLLLTLPGTVTTYYGEEIMMTDVNVPPDEQKDTFSHRDPERTPMQWNYTANAGFTPTGSTPWLPLAGNYSSVNVEVESATENKTSMLHLYKKLSALRSSEDAFKVGNYSCINATQDLLVFIRYTTDDESFKKVYVIAINFSPRNVSTTVSLGLSDTEVVVSSFLDKSGKIDLESLTLRGGEGLVVMGTLSTAGSCQETKKIVKNGVCNFCIHKTS